MSFIDLGQEFGDTKEPELAPEGKSYDLFCKDIEERKGDGKNDIRVMILVEDPDHEFSPIFHYLALPQPEKDQRNDEEKGHKPGTTTRTKLLMTKRFLHAFGITFTSTGFSPQDIPGARARLPVTQGTFTRKDGSTGRNNSISLPMLPSEEASGVTQGETQKKKAK